MKTWIRVFVALVLCAALLIFVVDIKDVFATLGRCDPLWAVIVLVALTADRVLMSYKWGLLLEIRNHRIGLRRQLMVYCSAMMWGLALPSTIGADGIRVVLARRFGVGVDDGIATIFVERGMGFICALLIALLGIGLLRTQVELGPAFDSLLLLGSGTLVAAVGIVAFSFSAQALNWMRLLPARIAMSRVVQAIHRLHSAYRSLAVDRERIMLFSTLTVLEQVLMIACYGLTAVALEIDFDPVFLFAAVPLGILVSRLPISIDGIGVYEGIFMAIMTLGGVRPEDSLAISLAMRALQVIVWFPWWLMMAVEMRHLRPPLTTERPR
ncbi:MAG TPA: lysylphosphatidylglycerol synthase transmembrane domain-containing protein [Steroidobacteraceae bacterium]